MTAKLPPLSAHLAEKAKPWPGYFLVRTTGEVVPLIAIDELPTGTDLEGVPRSLDLEDTIGMLNLGLQRSSGATYQVTKQEEKKEVSPSLVLRTKTLEAPQRPKAANSSNISPSSRSPVPNSANPPTKTYGSLKPLSQARFETQVCRHWCTHGVCKWGQQCRYRHIMPMTLSGLQDVGLADWPAWYRALNAGYFHSQGTQAPPTGPDRRAGARPCAGDERYGRPSPAAAHGALRGSPGHVRFRGAGHGRMKRETMGLGEQILERLRTLPKDSRRLITNKDVDGKGVGNNASLERATLKGTRNWEEEGDDAEVDEKPKIEQKKAKGGAKEKLVDV